ncbi:MAG TPA: hypothetical protein VGA55_07035 [Bacteroidota bacterium]
MTAKSLKRIIPASLTFAVCLESVALAQSLGVSFDKHYGQIEVGGRYAGLEFHESWPLPSRISFFYPVANSIDLSTDYWKRSESRPFTVTLRTGSGTERELGRDGWTYFLQPHKVRFTRQDGIFRYAMTYEFALNQPAFVFSFIVTNTDRKPHSVSVSTLLRFTLRTCQTYAWKEATEIHYDSVNAVIVARFDSPDTDSAAVFVMNVGDIAGTMSRGVEGGFEYERMLTPGDSLTITQVVGSCYPKEVDARMKKLSSSWAEEIRSYDQQVQSAAFGEFHVRTGDEDVDLTGAWARAILASNAHYLDGDIVPMPCPAEYNFFFTHDLLLTDLGAVHFDLPRVKRDLLYLLRRAQGGLLPHAYYWRDGKYVTELCAPDNWNHLWFISVSAAYLRHSFDSATGELLYPMISRSLDEALSRLGKDWLMEAGHPDWWDIGNRPGPRTYLTVLTIKAIRDYLFVSAFLGKQTGRLAQLSNVSGEMQNALSTRLWDGDRDFLMNENGSEVDPHYYAGSILAAGSGILDSLKSQKLLETTARELVVPGLGVRTAMPADFHTDSLIRYFKLVGLEAGPPFAYINGGIWPQCNAWYVLGLNEAGRAEDAVTFFRSTMSLPGIMRSPMGQPAMYEYRFSDSSSPEFGKIDKPSFLWAGGLTLDVLYRLLAVRETSWNCSISDRRVWVNDTISLSSAAGSGRDLRIVGTGSRLSVLRANAASIPSLVLPLSVAGEGPIEAVFGELRDPYLEAVNAIVLDIRAMNNGLHLSISSFDGHVVSAAFRGPASVKQVLVDGATVEGISSTVEEDGSVRSVVTFEGSDERQTVTIGFR